jgi:hypothetical protein
MVTAYKERDEVIRKGERGAAIARSYSWDTVTRMLLIRCAEAGRVFGDEAIVEGKASASNAIGRRGVPGAEEHPQGGDAVREGDVRGAYERRAAKCQRGAGHG